MTGVSSQVHQEFLRSDRIYTCSGCHAHLARDSAIISKGFQGRHGRAFLFQEVENVTMGPKEDRILMTGLHTVADILCNVCQSTVGWIYLYAFEESQKYKEGKYIVEKAKISKESQWISGQGRTAMMTAPLSLASNHSGSTGGATAISTATSLAIQDAASLAEMEQSFQRHKRNGRARPFGRNI